PSNGPTTIRPSIATKSRSARRSTISNVNAANCPSRRLSRPRSLSASPARTPTLLDGRSPVVFFLWPSALFGGHQYTHRLLERNQTLLGIADAETHRLCVDVHHDVDLLVNQAAIRPVIREP